MKLLCSNSLDQLAWTLNEYLAQNPSESILQPEVLLVQSKGMARWLSLNMAEHHQICANVQYWFPRQLLPKLLEPLFPEQQTFLQNPWMLTWDLMALLPKNLDKPEFQRLQSYLSQTPTSLKHFQLCQKLTKLFTHYLLYRNDWLQFWEGLPSQDPQLMSVDAKWQSMLWKQLCDAHPNKYSLKWFSLLPQKLPQLHQHQAFPERLICFGINSVPPLYFQVLQLLSTQIPVLYFWQNPSQEYWGDLSSQKKAAKQRQQQRKTQTSIQPSLFDAFEDDGLFGDEVTHPLLASCGQVGQQFLNQCLESGLDMEEAHVPSPHNTTLAHLQNAILGEGSLLEDMTDGSIQLHVCHHPLREIEVLHDQMLSWFEQDLTLKPKDILVMAPDIETYAAYLPSVFGMPASEKVRIPYSIADRRIHEEMPLIQMFLQLLELHSKRLSSQEVLSFLEHAPVHSRFELAEEDLESIQYWLQQTHVHWGKDAEHTHSWDGASTKEHTWQHGLERLLLGFALPLEEQSDFAGVLPYDAIEGESANVLGKLSSMVHTLFQTLDSFQQAQTLPEWEHTLQKALNALFQETSQQSASFQFLRDVFHELATSESAAESPIEVSITVIQSGLKELLRQKDLGIGFLGSGVTFCSMLPMRSVPFKVVALLGMNESDFPRFSPPPSFDLSTQKWRLGDRNQRQDDRYLFLETLLSAQHRLHLSYVGFHPQDQRHLLPSVVIQELQTAVNVPVVHHPRFGFDACYFEKDSDYFSYSPQMFQAAQAWNTPHKAHYQVCESALTLPESPKPEVDVQDLIRFWQHPTRFFFQNQLQLQYPEDSVSLDASEPFVLKGLSLYDLSQKLVALAQKGVDLSKYYAHANAAGWLPSGVLGKTLYDQLLPHLQSYVSHTPVLTQETGGRYAISLNLNGTPLTGTLKHVLSEKGCVSGRYAKTKARDLLSLWISHLVMHQMPSFHEAHSHHWGYDREKGLEHYHLQPTPQSTSILNTLIDHYHQGQQRPLPFWPQTLWSYWEELQSSHNDVKAWKVAQSTWEGAWKLPGEQQDVHYQTQSYTWEDIQPQLEQLAHDVYGPLWECLEKE